MHLGGVVAGPVIRILADQRRQGGVLFIAQAVVVPVNDDHRLLIETGFFQVSEKFLQGLVQVIGRSKSNY